MTFTRIFTCYLILFCMMTVVSAASAEDPKEKQALFVGNSYCDYYVIPGQVAAMLKKDGTPVICRRQTKGGFSLEKHWKAGQAEERIKNQKWEFVVLQNHSRSSLDHRDSFDVYGKKFIDLVKSAKTQPILYLTWARQHLPEDQKTITEAYCTLGVHNNIKVAPVGVAFEKWLKKNPTIGLHIKDKSHPNEAGAYLSACVLYATITGKSPVGQTYSIDGYNWVTKGQKLADLDPKLARALQEIAWETVKNFDPKKYASETPPKTELSKPAPPKTTEPTKAVKLNSKDLYINFGGRKKVKGWNLVGGSKSKPKALVDAEGNKTQATIEVNDPFQSYANPGVFKGELTGEAVIFTDAADKTLFTNRDKGNPTGGFILTLDPDKTYTIRLWASRSASGRRWGKYAVKGDKETSQFLAAGGESGAAGNPSTVLAFKNIKPDAEGKITVTVGFPAKDDAKKNIGDFVYLTGAIISPEEKTPATAPAEK